MEFFLKGLIYEPTRCCIESCRYFTVWGITTGAGALAANALDIPMGIGALYGASLLPAEAVTSVFTKRIFGRNEQITDTTLCIKKIMNVATGIFASAGVIYAVSHSWNDPTSYISALELVAITYGIAYGSLTVIDVVWRYTMTARDEVNALRSVLPQPAIPQTTSVVASLESEIKEECQIEPP